ncbi:response regulator [Nesterenkonia ebinurensis]|uniref:response regulator n=1 Tax=Nesterenkonia ebinurensis TaxID=2608252 RepID=UPI00123E44B0|nr:response regulator transcription factor [Nesterenkonia ebinurensis]
MSSEHKLAAAVAPITVLLADDHSSVRTGLRLLLETAEGIEVVGEASDGESAVKQVRALWPDVVLMDARMPGTDGIAATRRITAETDTEVLMLTTFDLDEVVFGALRAGAAGFLLKSAEPRDLIAAIRRVAAGDGVVAAGVTRRLLDAFVSGESAQVAEEQPVPDKRLAQLTPREQEVLATLGRGLGNAQIAAELFISEATVKSHVSSLLAKLHLTSRMQAAVLARETGLVP